MGAYGVQRAGLRPSTAFFLCVSLCRGVYLFSSSVHLAPPHATLGASSCSPHAVLTLP